jgi:hypothetical protein
LATSPTLGEMMPQSRSVGNAPAELPADALPLAIKE